MLTTIVYGCPKKISSVESQDIARAYGHRRIRLGWDSRHGDLEKNALHLSSESPPHGWRAEKEALTRSKLRVVSFEVAQEMVRINRESEGQKA